MSLFKSIAVFGSIATAIAVPAFASGIQKTGDVLLQGQKQAVKIEARSGSGQVTIGDKTFKVVSSSSRVVEGSLLEKEGMKKVKDLRLTISFESDTNESLKALVSNGDELNCTGSSNAVILISDDLKGEIIGNCAQLN